MGKVRFTREDIERVYDEIDRRIDADKACGLFTNESEIKEYRNAMMQGVYGTLMALASNWSDVRCTMIDPIEEVRYWNELGYKD